MCLATNALVIYQVLNCMIDDYFKSIVSFKVKSNIMRKFQIVLNSIGLFLNVYFKKNINAI